MKAILIGLAVFALTFGSVSIASANCADDAVDTCNAKHPDPDKSDHAYELYELCIKAQLGQQCPNSSSSNQAVLGQVQAARKGVAPKCPAGHTLKVDWKGKEDRCIQNEIGIKSTETRSLRMR